jgi:hypothetical protein
MEHEDEHFPMQMPTSNYVGVFGTVDLHDACEHGDCQGDGLFVLNRGMRMADILDGLSQTLMVGERHSRWSYSTWVGAVAHAEHGPARIVGVAQFPPNSDDNPEQFIHNFSSLHPAGTHFLRADGSVRLIYETIDPGVYLKLCTRSKGDIIDKDYE